MSEMRTPIEGDVIKGLGLIIEILNEDGRDKFWGKEPYMKVLGWEDPYHGLCYMTVRSIEEKDVCTPSERLQFFLRATIDLRDSIKNLEDDIEILNKETEREFFLLEVIEDGKRVFEYVMSSDLSYHHTLIHHEEFEKLVTELIDKGREYSEEVGTESHVLEDGKTVVESLYIDKIKHFFTPQDIFEHLKRVCDCKLLEYR